MKAKYIDEYYSHYDFKDKSLGELQAHIQTLETFRSSWERRIRLCEEREYMYKTMLNDMATLLATTFQHGHDAVSANAAKATEMIEAIQACMRKLDYEA